MLRNHNSSLSTMFACASPDSANRRYPGRPQLKKLYAGTPRTNLNLSDHIADHFEITKKPYRHLSIDAKSFNTKTFHCKKYLFWGGGVTLYPRVICSQLTGLSTPGTATAGYPADLRHPDVEVLINNRTGLTAPGQLSSSPFWGFTRWLGNRCETSQVSI